MKRTVKEISEEIGVSKQAVFKKMKPQQIEGDGDGGADFLDRVSKNNMGKVEPKLLFPCYFFFIGG